MSTPGGADDTLREDVTHLRDELATLNRHMLILIKNEVAESTIPREELVDRLRRNFWRLMFVTVFVIILAVGINRITLVQAGEKAERDLSRQVTQCFLNAGSNTPAQARECGRRFGPEYTRSQQRSAQTLSVFVKLQQRVKHLEDELAALKE